MLRQTLGMLAAALMLSQAQAADTVPTDIMQPGTQPQEEAAQAQTVQRSEAALLWQSRFLGGNRISLQKDPPVAELLVQIGQVGHRE